MEKRRINLRPVFKECGFELKNALKKADEYESKNALYPHIYFYWNQGKSSINIAIDPNYPYLDLLEINGVILQEKLPKGLRGGSTMKHFPSQYPGIILKEPQKAGRMFSIQESALPKFLNHITSGLMPNALSISINNSENNSNIKGNSENTISSVGASSEILEALELIIKAIDDEYKNKPGKDIDAIVKRRVGQSEFRSLLEVVHGSYCHTSLIENRRLLIASHIIPWSRSTGEEKTDPNNGLLLAVNWDAVFDKGLISFDDKGKVIFSDDLDEKTSNQLGLDRNVTLREGVLTSGRKKYLQRHRQDVFEYWKK